MKKKNKQGYYKVKRYVIEEYEVFAPSRKEALLRTEGPCEVIVIKETCKKVN
jgi:hypothetical protein